MDPLVAALQNATSSAELKAAVDALPRDAKYYTEQVRDLILPKKNLIVDAATADSIISFLLEYLQLDPNAPTRSALRIPEIRDLLMSVVAPRVISAQGAYCFARSICRIVQDKPSAELYSAPEYLKVVLSFLHRATTAEGARWASCSIYNILNNHPDAKKIFNTLPVVEAFSALIPHAIDDDSVAWVSWSLKNLLHDNNEAQEMFGTPTFFDQFNSMEKFAISDSGKASFKSVVDILRQAVNRRMEKSFGDATTSQELTSILSTIIRRSYCRLSLINLLLSKQHLIQDEESTASTAKFLKWCFGKNQKSIQKKEIYELFQNILLPKSLNFRKSIRHVDEVLALIIQNSKEAQEFFSTTSFKECIIASLPHANESVLQLLNSLLIDNKKGQAVFGTPNFTKQLERRFFGNSSQEFNRIIKILTEQIVQVRFDALKKLVADHKEKIDETCLKKLAENEIDVADLLVVEPVSWVIQLQFTIKQNVVMSRIIQKMKDKTNGVPVHPDPFKLQEIEQLRQEHNDLRKLHQDHVTSSSKSNDNLKIQLQDEKQKHSSTMADSDAKSKKIDDLNNQLQQEQDKLTSASATFTKDLDDAQSQITQLQAEINLLKQDKALPSDAPPPSRCFANVRPAPFEESLRRLLALTDVPAGRSDLNTYIPAQNTADLVLRYLNDNLAYLKGKPEIQDLINNFRITDDDIKAILTVKIEHPYPVYRWLNGHLTGQRGDKVASAIGPYFVLLYRALEKLPKIKAKASRAVLIRDIPALRATFDNYETKCEPQKAMNFWGVSSFSRKDKVGANEFAGTPDEEALIYSCAELEGVDLEPFRPQGMLAEYEILPLCPMVCRIQNVTKVGAKVVIGIRQCEHADYSYAEPTK